MQMMKPLLVMFTLVAMGPIVADVLALQGQSTDKSEQLLHQVHASRALLDEPLESMEGLLARCDSVWNESRAASWAREPEGVQAEAEGLLWLDRALEEPLPGARAIFRPDRTSLARYLLLARRHLPPEAVKLRVPCEQLEKLVSDLREKARTVDVHTRSWEAWRKTVAEAVIEEPRALEESWSGTLEVRVPAGTAVDVYRLGEHVERMVADEDVVAGRYERSLRPYEAEWQGIVVIGKDPTGREVSASRIVWVKGGVVKPLYEQGPPPEPVAQPSGGKAPQDERIAVALFEGFEEVPASEPDPVASFHQGRGHVWGPEDSKKLYPWRIRHEESGLEFVLVPAGELHLPQQVDFHDISIRKPFYLAKYEVSIEAWSRFTDRTHYRTRAENEGGGWVSVEKKLFKGLVLCGVDGPFSRARRDKSATWKTSIPDLGPRMPVRQVAFEDALAFCEHYGYRLPTTEEWEWAALFGTSFPDTGDDWWHKRVRSGDQRLLENLRDDAFEEQVFKNIARCKFNDGHALVAPIGSYEPHPLGMFDMFGNVSEWCAPSRPGEKEQAAAWTRGGNYISTQDPYWMSITGVWGGDRSHDEFFCSDDTGFRVVLPLE